MPGDPMPPEEKSLMEIDAVIKNAGGEEEVHKLFLKVPKNFKIPDEAARAQFETELLEKLKGVSPQRGNSITALGTKFNYADATSLQGFDKGDTLVVVNLPYCLHLPHQTQAEIKITEMGLDAQVTFEKYWTTQASIPESKSDNSDFYAEDTVLYFNKSIVQTPKIPLHPEEGWAGLYTGINIEKNGDQNGTFRYTRLLLQFDSNIKTAEEIERLDENLIAEIRRKTQAIVNRIVDIYRATTGEAYIRRRSDLNIHIIYFPKLNSGFNLMPVNIGTAQINRSRNEIKKIKDDLSKGLKPEVYKLFLLDAQQSSETDNRTLAIAESFQGFEVFLEDYLTKKLIDSGKTDQEAAEYLSKDENWKTPVRLKSALKTLTGKSLADETALWTDWLRGYRNTRNEVLHDGKEASKEEVENVLKSNLAVIQWLSNI